MSADLNVFIKADQLPTREEWMEAIGKHGFQFKFDDEFNPEDHQGFLPCTFEGKEAGFEYYCDKIEETGFEDDPAPELEGKELCVGFCSSFDREDLSCAMIAAGSLAKLTGGSFWLMDDFESNEDPIEMAKHIVENGLD